MMYDVCAHHFGRSVIRRGVASGCVGFVENEWRGVGRFRSLPKAIERAKAHPTRATVTPVASSQVLFDNGKNPAPRHECDTESARLWVRDEMAVTA